jgi:hypothetical protein
MGKDWDHGIPGVVFWQEALRIAKPGCHLLAFGGTRTFHRLAVAIEDAGWEIRDTVMWVYGSGFPKSHNVGKAVDKLQGNERKIIGEREVFGTARKVKGKQGIGASYTSAGTGVEFEEHTIIKDTIGTSEYEGYGTALKPAWEPIIVARKSLEGTVANNVLKWGTGAINIDGCRVGTSADMNPADFDDSKRKSPKFSGTFNGGKEGQYRNKKGNVPNGRFPANLIHDGSDEVVGLFPVTTSGSWKGQQKGVAFGHNETGKPYYWEGDSGSAARFFYCAKASKRERNAGLDSTRTAKFNCDKSILGGLSWKDASTELVQLLKKVTSELTVRWNTGECGEGITGRCQLDSLSITLTEINKITTSKILDLLMHSPTSVFIQDANCETVNGGNLATFAESSNQSTKTTGISQKKDIRFTDVANIVISELLSWIKDEENWKQETNIHSTVKPLALMRYLCRLVTPPDGVVLDPFCGSGSTLVGALQEGFRYLGIEKDPDYVNIAYHRTKGALKEMGKETKQLLLDTETKEVSK